MTGAPPNPRALSVTFAEAQTFFRWQLQIGSGSGPLHGTAAVANWVTSISDITKKVRPRQPGCLSPHAEDRKHVNAVPPCRMVLYWWAYRETFPPRLPV